MNFNNIETITGEQVFRVYASSMWIPSTTSGYTLMYSGDNNEWLSWNEDTAANEPNYVSGFDSGLYFKLSGNTDTITITY